MPDMSVAHMVQIFLRPNTPLRVEAFDGSSFGPQQAPVCLQIHRSRAIYYMIQHPDELGLARAYLQGDIDSPQLVPGDPYEVFAYLTSLKPYLRKPDPRGLLTALTTIAGHGVHVPKPPSIEGPSRFARLREGLLPHTEAGDAATVGYHYNQSNEFYSLFLGSSMTYTCALFNTPQTSLEDAQRAKLELVLDKLDLKPGDRLLDIGCGWGSMEVLAARRGIRVIGVTLSSEQVAWGKAWIHREGLDDLAEIRLMDYREVPEGDFDGICSLGMMEHVGVRHYAAYFREMYNKLKPEHMLLNHQITRTNSHGRKAAGPFIDRYIFPDGELASPAEIETEIENTGFEIIHEENLRQHYALTLHHWNHNLVDHWDEAVRSVGEPKARLWGLYMAGCALNFELNTIQIHQFLCMRPNAHGTSTYPLRPWWLHR